MLYLVDKISVKEIDNWENEKDLCKNKTVS